MRTRDERGSVLGVVLALAVALLFLGGFSLDFWRVIAERRTLAAMADAAAQAGADGLDETSLRTGGAALDPAVARALALAQLRRESDHAHVTATRVEATPATVDVTLTGHTTFTLLGIMETGDFTVVVHARAAPARSP